MSGWAAAFAVGAALLAGCASGPAPVDHYYRIEVAPPAAASAKSLAGTVEVDRLRVEDVAQGRRMLYRRAAGSAEIGQHSYHHWVDPPNVMIQQALVSYLRAAGAADQIVTPAVHVDSDYRLTGRIVRLERMLDSGQVVVELEIAVVRNEGDEVVLLKTYRDERPASGGAVADSVSAYGAALRAIFERLTADLAAA